MPLRSVPFVLVIALATACADDAPGPLTGPEPERVIVAGPLDTTSIAVGVNHACALDTLGSAWCWGINTNGTLGRESTQTCTAGLTPCSWVPLRVRGGHEFLHISSSGGHTCGIEAGTQQIWCWGAGGSGQLGQRSTSSSMWPVHADAGADFTSVSGGLAHTCGLAENGRIWCWGLNNRRQVGGTETTVLVPRVVQGLRRFRMVSAGERHTCAIDVDGIAWCWGDNEFGALGDSATMGSLSAVPVRVRGGGRWIWISAGSYYTCGVRTTNVAYCWGLSSIRSLGSDRPSGPTPTRIDGSAKFLDVDAGVFNACGRNLNGRVICWGDNRHGATGTGSTSTSSPPVRTSDKRPYGAVGAGQRFACGTTSGSVICWGVNTYGNVGRSPGESATCEVNDPCEPGPVRVRSRVGFAY